MRELILENIEIFCDKLDLDNENHIFLHCSEIASVDRHSDTRDNKHVLIN